MSNLVIEKSISFFEKDIYKNSATIATISSVSQSFVSFTGILTASDAGLTFVIPDDYHDNLSFTLIWCMDGSTTNQARITLDIRQFTDETASFTKAADETLEFLDNGQASAAWRVQTTSTQSSGLTWSRGDVCTIEFNRNPLHASDTMGTSFYLSCLLVKYNTI